MRMRRIGAAGFNEKVAVARPKPAAQTFASFEFYVEMTDMPGYEGVNHRDDLLKEEKLSDL